MSSEAKERIKYIILALFFITMILALCLLAVIFNNHEKEIFAAPVITDEVLYQNQGLSPGKAMESQPLHTTEELVMFKDRLAYRCVYQREEMVQGINSVNNFLTAAKEKRPDIATYLMFVPLRIAYDDPFTKDPIYQELIAQEKVKLKNVEDQLLFATSNLTKFIPLMNVLENHKEEYIFYRTMPEWTMKGAYYGGQAFLGRTDLGTFPIKVFNEMAKNSTVGLFPEEFQGYEDRQYYYIYGDYNPLVENLDENEKSPMISLTRGGTGAFLGYGDSCYIIPGTTENGRVLMLLGGENATVLAPWMVARFQKIICVNIPFFSTENIDLWKLVEENKVTDLLLVEDLFTLISTHSMYTLEELSNM